MLIPSVSTIIVNDNLVFCIPLLFPSFQATRPHSDKTHSLLHKVVDKFFHNGISFVITSEQKRLENKEYHTRGKPRRNINESSDALPRYVSIGLDITALQS